MVVRLLLASLCCEWGADGVLGSGLAAHLRILTGFSAPGDLLFVCMQSLCNIFFLSEAVMLPESESAVSALLPNLGHAFVKTLEVCAAAHGVRVHLRQSMENFG